MTPQSQPTCSSERGWWSWDAPLNNTVHAALPITVAVLNRTNPQFSTHTRAPPEFAQGELFEVLEDDQSLPEEVVQCIAKQLVRGQSLIALVLISGRLPVLLWSLRLWEGRWQCDAGQQQQQQLLLGSSIQAAAAAAGPVMQQQHLPGSSRSS